MRGESLDPYEAIFYILLHDVGKPIQRLARRYVEGIERREDAKGLMEVVTEKSIGVLAEIAHEEISKAIAKQMLGRWFSAEVEREIEKILKRADAIAAAERGFESIYRKVKPDLLERISTKLSEIKGMQLSYGVHTSPFLSPVWAPLIAGYLDYVGPKAYAAGKAGGWTAEEASKVLQQKLSKVITALKECDIDAVVDELAKLLASLLDEEIWFAVAPIAPGGFEALRAEKYLEAARRSSYGDVVKMLLEMLLLTGSIYGPSPRDVALRSLIDTVLAIMRSATLLVPSAVYASLVPDIGLYSHSKVVTAYAASELLGGVTDRYRLLLVDTNGIQQFISAPIKAAAASRVLRGKSLIVELAVDSLTHYVLEVFGGLPDANVLTSEGGVVEVVVPDSDVEGRTSLIERVAEEFSAKELGLGLGFTIAYSDPFDSSKAAFLYPLNEGKGYAEVLRSLEHNLALQKARRGVRVSKVYVREDEVLGFDAITGEPVTSGQELKLRVAEFEKGYVDKIAGPDKLSPGDLISEATHLSLVAGSTSRNLVAILGVHLYKRGERYPEPYHEGVRRVVGALCEKPGQLVRELATDKLKSEMGLVPFRSTGSVYILISLTRPEVYNPAEDGDVRCIWTLAGYVMQKFLAKVLEDLAREPGVEVRLDIKLVNSTDGFIPKDEEASRRIIELARRLIGAGVRVVFGYVLANAYHPAKMVEGGGIRLVDLDEYGIIALAKMDADMMGEVRKLISFSPSRLVTLSDMVSTIIAGKAYMHAVSMARELYGREKLLDAIPLYAGGDDITIYGKWAHVVKLASDIYTSVRRSIKPITISLAIAIDRESAPILELYERAASLLEEGAKAVKASGIIVERAPRVLRIDGKEVVVGSIPLEEPSQAYPWPPDAASSLTLEALAKILDPQKMYVNVFEEYKRDLYPLLNIGAELQELVEMEGRLDKVPLHELLRLEIAYAYVWSRRGDALRKVKEELNKISSNLSKTILAFPDETRAGGLREALRLILAAKPMLDCLILALRRRETVEPSSAVADADAKEARPTS